MGLKLGIVHWAFPPLGGGVETHLLTVCPEMVKQGAEVFVLTGSVEGAPEVEDFRGVRVRRCDEVNLDIMIARDKKGEDVYSSTKKVFAEFIDSNGIECIQAHNLHLDVFGLSRALLDVCQERSIPSHLIIHNERFYDRPEELMWNILKLPWTRLVPISRYIDRTLKSRGQENPDWRIPDDKWKVILHGIDLERFRPVDDEAKEKLKEEYGFKGRKVISLPARILPSKGCVEAIKGMAGVVKRFSEALLVLTGGVKVIFDETELARYHNKVKQTIEENNLTNNVFVATDYSYKDIPKICALSDVVTYPTVNINEPFGLGPVEGMAAGTAVLVTRSGGLIESTVDGVTGLVIDREEEKIPPQWAEKVIYLLSNPDKAKEMGRNGRKRVEEIFDKARMAGDFIQLSEELVAEAKRG